MSRVPLKPQLAAQTAVRNGTAVATRTWKPLSRQANFIIGHGAALAPGWSPTEVVSAGATVKYTLRTIPRLQALRRLYVIRMTGFAGPADNVQVVINGTARDHSTLTGFRNVAAFEYIEDLAALSTAEETLEVEIQNNGSTSLFVYGVAVWELPRAELTETSASLMFGCDPELVRAKQPIQDSDAGNIGGVARAIDAAAGIARRSSLFCWAVDEASAWTTANNVFQPVFELPIPILGRKLNYTDTSSSTQWRLWARMTDPAATGLIQLTESSIGSSAVISVTGTSFALHPTPPGVTNLLVDPEDVSTSDGRVGGAWDDVTVEGRVSAGAGSIEVAGIFCFETP